VNYIRSHWRGDLPLATAFWVNVFFVGLLFRFIDLWLEASPPIEHPVSFARFFVVYFAVAILLVYPWQIVGVWRSSKRYSEQSNSGSWGGVVRVLVVIGALGTAGNLSVSLPVVSDLSKIGFMPDEYSDYTFSVTDDGSLIHLQGGLGFGVSEDFADFLAEYDGITGVILDSRGGRIYEGRQLADIIFKNGLDTYSIAGCYSACGTAYVAGNRRFLSNGANLAFHQYRAPGDAIGLYLNIGTEQQKDLEIYRRKGISEDFLERIFLADQDDLWYPTVDELVASGVVHDLVNPSDLQTIDYGDSESGEMIDVIGELPGFTTIRTYEPEIYAELVAKLEQQMRAGASMVEMQKSVGSYIEVLAGQSLPITSDRALFAFANETMAVLRKLEAIDPILCIKNLFPQQYGSVNITNHLPHDDMTPMMEALGLVISDRYELQNPGLDIAAAESVFVEVMDAMGDAAYYLDQPLLENREDYSEACQAVVRFYELIADYDENTAGNALRHAFSP
jgi:hypothetical protein